jgi:hypothetical protein
MILVGSHMKPDNEIYSYFLEIHTNSVLGRTSCVFLSDFKL